MLAELRVEGAELAKRGALPAAERARATGLERAGLLVRVVRALAAVVNRARRAARTLERLECRAAEKPRSPGVGWWVPRERPRADPRRAVR